MQLPPREFLLVAGIVAFYLVDTARLLYRDEAQFVRLGTRWRGVPGSGHTLAGRYLTWPALLRPDAAVVQLPWDAPPEHGIDDAAWQAVLRATRALGALGWLMLALLLGMVPWALWQHWRPTWMLGLLAGIYGTSLAMTLLLVWWRKRLGLSARALGAIAIDILACPPFAINVVRRLTRRLSPALTGAQFCTQHVPDTDPGTPIFKQRQLLALEFDAPTQQGPET